MKDQEFPVEEIIRRLQVLQNHILLEDIEDWDEYFKNIKEKLKAELSQLQASM